MTRLVLAACFVSLPLATAAQEPASSFRPPRGDLAVTVGWLHGEVSGVSEHVPGLREEDWTHDQATIGASAGWYWTENAKTELSIETSSTTRVWDSEPILAGDNFGYRSVEHTQRHTSVSIGQYYQFGHNQWVHPSIGAGLVVRRRERTSEYAPGVIFPGPVRDPVVVVPPDRLSGTVTEGAAFVALAMKAYITPRAFFRADTQVDIRRGIDQVTARAGLGIDF
jgi:hypothetical protein